MDDRVRLNRASRPAGQAQAHLGNVSIIIRVVYGQNQPGNQMNFTLNETDTVLKLKNNVINEIMSHVNGLIPQIRPQIIGNFLNNFLNNFRFYLEGRIIEDNQTIRDIIPEQDRDDEEPVLRMLFKGDLPGYHGGGKRGGSKRRKSKKRKSKKKRRNKKFTQNRKKKRKMKGGADEGNGTDDIRNPLMKIRACLGSNLNSPEANKIASNWRPEAIRAFNQLNNGGEIDCVELEAMFDNHSMKDMGNCWADGGKSLEDKKKGFLGGVSSGICRP